MLDVILPFIILIIVVVFINGLGVLGGWVFGWVLEGLFAPPPYVNKNILTIPNAKPNIFFGYIENYIPIL